jgi:hypothetical protein
MFEGRVEEAKALYLAYKEEVIVLKRRNRLWEQVIAGDFAEFRKACVTHPMIADVEKGLGISPTVEQWRGLLDRRNSSTNT